MATQQELIPNIENPTADDRIISAINRIVLEYGGDFAAYLAALRRFNPPPRVEPSDLIFDFCGERRTRGSH